MLKWILSLLLMAVLLVGCTPPEEKPTIVPNQPIYIPPQLPQSTYTPPQTYTPAVPSIPSFGSIAGKTIIIDAGHGGKDPGSMGTRFSTMAEKKLNLSIATEVAKQLKNMGAKVVMTRASDKFIELADRAEIATRYKADLFVAIHCNSHPDSSRKGAVVYTSRSPSQRSRWAVLSLYWAIQNEGIKCEADQADYKVLTLHSKPSILVECGYLSNSTDCKRLNTPSYRVKIARGVAQGVANYFAKHG